MPTTVDFADLLKTTGSSGQRKALEAFGGEVITLDEFKIEERGKGIDKQGNPKAKRRVLSARVTADGKKPRTAVIPVRMARRFMELIENLPEGETLIVPNVMVETGTNGVSLKPVKHEQPEGAPRRGRGRRRQDQPQEQAAA